MKDIKQILESISTDILSEEVKKTIAEAFNSEVEAKVTDRIKLEVENELSKMDVDHSKKLDEMLKAIDADHTTKFKKVLEKVDARHTKMLKTVIEKYDKDLKEGAKSLKEELSDKLSKFLDLYLEKSIPENHLKEAVDNIHARKLVDEIKKIVSLDETFINKNIKESIQDGYNALESIKKDLNAKIQENVSMKQELIRAKSELILEKKTANLPNDKKKYVFKLLEGKKPEEIESNFAYVLEMFEKDEDEKRELIAENVKNTAVNKKIDTPKTVVKESIESDKVDNSSPSVNEYVKVLSGKQ